MRPTLVLALLAGVLAPARGPLCQAGLPRIDSLLVLEPVSAGGRSPVAVDALELELADGSWRPPGAGDPLQAPGGGERTWRVLEPDGEGWFADPALRGGYAFARFDWPVEEVLLLAARGHRHVYANGVPRAGDVYDLGFVALPIQLRKGANELLFRAGRGRLKIAFARPPAAVFIAEADTTLPHVIREEAGPWWAGIPVVNAAPRWSGGLALKVVAGGRVIGEQPVPPLPPLGLRKVPVALRLGARHGEQQIRIGLELLDEDGAPLHGREVVLEARAREATHRRTFVSGIDGSVQYFGVTPPAGNGPDPMALFLTLHGAGVDALGQAGCYAPKQAGVVVAPTNRRPFGFDWEDWGRLDALEVLDAARALYRVDPRRIYLTGHSMGGHGTWHLGVHYPGLFAAIAPSAGWRDFWSYGGAVHWEAPDPVEEVLARAMNASRTLMLEHNLRHCGVYILHGDKDTNVPVDQARFMRGRLGAFHSDWAYYERPGAEHWWGDRCVDWPPLFDFLLRTERPTAAGPVRFACLHPGISARCQSVAIHAQARPFALSTVEAAFQADRRTLVVQTENVAVLALAPPEPVGKEGPGLPGGRPASIQIDGQRLEGISWPAQGELRLERCEGCWSVWTAAAGEGPAEKSPERAGPFKDAFRNRMLLVYGTGGDAEERAWALAKARYDAETFWYRGNGSVEILADTDYDPGRFAERNVILYGNADMNAAWTRALAPGCPLIVRRGWLQVGERAFAGEDMACLFVYPHRRREWTRTLVGVVAGSGGPGMRATNQLPYFVSGVAYPDWTVLGVEALQKGSKGVRGAGFFDRHWRLLEPAFR